MIGGRLDKVVAERTLHSVQQRPEGFEEPAGVVARHQVSRPGHHGGAALRNGLEHPVHDLWGEHVAVAAPDVYLATVESRVSLASLEEDELLGSLPAVLGERVVIIDRGMLDVGGPDIIAAVTELAEILHPEAG